MSSLDGLFEASPVYFQDVNERSTPVKMNRVSCRRKSLISLVVGRLSTLGFYL